MIYFLDTEFSNLDPISGDILVMYLVIDNEQNETVYEKEFRCQVQSRKYWESEAEDIHGISYTEASLYPHPKEMCASLLELGEKYPCTKMVMQTTSNSWFDNDRKKRAWAWIDYYYLELTFRKHGNHYEFYKLFPLSVRESTIDLAKKAGIKKRGLKHLAEQFNLELNHHDAKSDTLVMRDIWQILTRNTKKTASRTTTTSRKTVYGFQQTLL